MRLSHPLFSVVGLVSAVLTLHGCSCGSDVEQNEPDPLPAVKTLSLTPSESTLAVGESVTLTALLDGEEDVTANVLWTLSGEEVSMEVATVTARAPGAATVTAQWGDQAATATLTVTDARLLSVRIEPEGGQVPVGRTLTFTAMGSFTDGQSRPLVAGVTWHSSAPEVATLGEDGTALGISTGESRVWVTAGDLQSPQVTLTVTPPVIDAITLSPTQASVPMGLTASFTAVATLSDGQTEDVTAAATWSSSQPSVASVAAGMAQGLTEGMTEVTATLDGVLSAPATLTVTPALVTDVEVTPVAASVAKGRTQVYVATASYTDGSQSDVTSHATWALGDPAVATFLSPGEARGEEVGATDLTATFDGVISAAVLLTVTPAEVDTFDISPASAQVAMGRTQVFTASATWSDGTTEDVTVSALWSSAPVSVATISTGGLASTHQVGTASISATWNGFNATAQLTVAPPELDALTLSPLDPEVPAGFTRQLGATGHWSDGTLTDVTSQVVWTSQDQGVATVDATGQVQGVAAGQSLVTATAPGGGASASTTVTVTSVALTSLSVTPNTAQVPAGGVILPLTATGYFSDGTTADLTQQATWTSADPTVALVGDAGLDKGRVTSGATATATSVSITATLNGEMATAVVTVVPATLTAIALSPLNASLPAGFDLPYTATGTFSDGNAYDLTHSAAWASSDPAVATISNAPPTNGVAHGVGQGSVDISATFGGQSAITQLSVTSASLVSLSLSPATASRAVGLTLQYSVLGVFSDGATVDLTQGAVWLSSDPSVATVSSGVGPRGLATVVGHGATTITAAYGGLTATAQLTGEVPALTGIVVTPVNATIGGGGFIQMYATANFSDGSTQDVTSMAAWASSNAAVATVRNDLAFRGMVVGAAPGVATITATWGVFAGSRNVTVSSATLTELYVTPALPKIGVGTTVPFQASGVWSDGTTADLTEVAAWTSSAPIVAPISNATGTRGLVTGMAAGTSTIIATWNGISDVTSVTVTAAPLVAVQVTPADRDVPLGTELQYTAIAQYADGTLQDVTSQVAWQSSDPAVAVVSNTTGSVGRVTAVGAGTATLSVQLGATSGSTTLTVRSVSLTSLALTPANAKIPAGSSRSYTLVGTFSDGSTENLSHQASWTTGDAQVAVATSTGGNVATVTGVAAGTTTVTATVFGVQASVPVEVVAWTLCAITVTPADSSLKVGQSRQMIATGTYGAACPATAPDLLTLDITKQVTWRVVPRQRISVSNSPGSIGVATATSIGAPSFGNVHAERGAVSGATKLFAVP